MAGGGGQEHRRAPRRPVFGNAVIRGPNLHADCVIRDLSASGARIQVDASVPLPEEFNLLLVEANSSRHVLLKWRAGDFAGVAFSQIEAAASAPEAVAQTQRLPSPRPPASPPAPGTIRGDPEKSHRTAAPGLGSLPCCRRRNASERNHPGYLGDRRPARDGLACETPA